MANEISIPRPGAVGPATFDPTFIGRGFYWPLQVDHTGAIRLTDGAADLDRSMAVVLATAPGERVMRPEFGCRIWELLFEPVTANLLGLMAQAVRDALAQWEPRVVVERVDPLPDPVDSALVVITIVYRVKSTNDRRNLVYPFYVIPRGDLMVLPAPNLDDRTFQDIVDEAKRLIPRYTPEWTNHNLSDPGVALIELFAWMSETVLYRLNQVPDRLYVHFLNLVGIEPFPPSVARAPITFWLSAVQERPVTIPAGMQVATSVASGATGPVAGDSSVVFTTVEDLVIKPPELVNALTTDGGMQRFTACFDDLRFPGVAVPCFTSVDGSGHLVPDDSMLLGFADSLAGMAIRLSVQANAQGIGVDPKRPPLAWEVWSGEAWIAVEVFSDSTGGLNRAGEIVLMIPRQHEVLSLANIGAYWLRVKLLAPAAGQPTYQVSPQLDALEAAALGATVDSEHSITAPSEILGRSDGSPAQEFQVTFQPVLPRRESETVRVTDSSGSVHWIEVADFSRSGPSDSHFVWESSSGIVRFGPRVRYPDGTARQHGRVPRDGAEIAVTGYRHGGGASGNVGARTLTVLRSSLPYVAGCVNLRPAVGGVDAETVAEAKARGPLTLRTGQRAVTAGDFERLTLESSIEVARARCLPSATGRGPVRLLVVPQVRTDIAAHRIDDFALTKPLLQTVSEHLDAHRIVGTAVEVGVPYYQGVSVAALVHAPPSRPLALVRQRALVELTRLLHPLVGGVDGTGWPFDTDLNAAVITQLLSGVEGIDRVDEVQLFEYDLRTRQRKGAGREMVRLEPHTLFLSGVHQVVVR